MPNLVVATSTSDGPDQVYCTCLLTVGEEVKVEIDDGAILMSCPRCGRQVSLETVSVHASKRAVTLTAESELLKEAGIWAEYAALYPEPFRATA